MSIKTIAKQISAFFNYNTSITLNNKKFTVPIIRNMGSQNLMVKESWFYRLLKAIELPANTCFIDVGANVGQTVMTFRSRYNNTYIGFEPSPACVFYLDVLMRRNKIKDASILPIGLSSDNFVAKFYQKSNIDQAGTTQNELRPGHYQAEDVSYVPVFAFDKLDLDLKQPISLIKIDVEGGELEVVTGMTETIRKYRPAVICEILDSHTEENIPKVQARADKLIALVKSLDYDVYHLLHGDGQLHLKPLQEVKLKKWVIESHNLNDYLFLPKGDKYPELKKIMN